MKFVPQTARLLSESDIDKRIQICGQVAWRTDLKEKQKTPPEFVKMIMNRRHTSVLEHAPITLDLPIQVIQSLPSTKYLFTQGRHVAGNVRAWFELIQRNRGFGELRTIEDYLSRNYSSTLFKKHDRVQEFLIERPIYEPFPFYTFIIDTDRGMTHELVRHRILSFTQESTRYVMVRNLTVVDCGCADGAYIDALNKIEDVYANMVESGIKPQFARSILPTCTSARIAISGFQHQWDEFFHLRLAEDAHPQMISLARTMRKLVDHAIYDEVHETEKWEVTKVKVA